MNIQKQLTYQNILKKQKPLVDNWDVDRISLGISLKVDISLVETNQMPFFLNFKDGVDLFNFGFSF